MKNREPRNSKPRADSHDPISRRPCWALGLPSTFLAAACGNGIGSNGGRGHRPAREVDAVLHRTRNLPATRRVLGPRTMPVGMLVDAARHRGELPFGGSFGARRTVVRDVTVDTIHQAQGSFGLQIGAQPIPHVRLSVDRGSTGGNSDLARLGRRRRQSSNGRGLTTTGA